MENQSSTPVWMTDPLVKDIDPQKLSFLARFYEETRGKDQKKLMVSLLSLLKQARQDHLTFSSKELSAITAAIKKHSTAEESARIDQILARQEKK